jgi:hypothetical protein
MGVPPHFILNIGSLQDDDVYWACELVRAMALVENGNGCANLIRREEIRKGYKLAFSESDARMVFYVAPTLSDNKVVIASIP